MSERSGDKNDEQPLADMIHEVVDWQGMKASLEGGTRIVLHDALLLGDKLAEALTEETARRRRAEILLIATQQAYVREREERSSPSHEAPTTGATPETDELQKMLDERRRPPMLAVAIVLERMRGMERRLLASSATATITDGIYVASRVVRAPVWKAYRDKGVKINASWIDEAGEGETGDFGELWQRIRGEIAASKALVFYAAGVEDFPFKGALVEVGMALAMEKPVFLCIEDVMLDGRTLRPLGSWALDRRVTMCDTLDEAISRADGGGA